MNAGIDRWVLAGGERLRLYFLDVPGGNVVVDVDDFEGSNIDTLIESAAPIIKSFVFADDAAGASASPAASPSASAAP